jgi:RNA polymerase sigma-70 factor (ECF subfamily)
MASETETDDWLPTRRSLLTRLRLVDDHAGWQEFFDTYWRLLYGVARKAGLNDAEAQDAVQDCVITITRQMPKFRYDPERCSFKGWLLMILRQRVGRQFRKRAAGAVGDVSKGPQPGLSEQESEVYGSVHGPNSMSDPFQAIWETEWQQHIVVLATERVKKLVSDAQFQIFDLHVLRDWPPTEVAQTLGVSRAQIYLAKLRVGRRFKQELDSLRNGAERKSPSQTRSRDK